MSLPLKPGLCLQFFWCLFIQKLPVSFSGFYLPLHIWEYFIVSKGYPTWNNCMEFNWFKEFYCCGRTFLYRLLETYLVDRKTFLHNFGLLAAFSGVGIIIFTWKSLIYRWTRQLLFPFYQTNLSLQSEWILAELERDYVSPDSLSFGFPFPLYVHIVQAFITQMQIVSILLCHEVKESYHVKKFTSCFAPMTEQGNQLFPSSKQLCPCSDMDCWCISEIVWQHEEMLWFTPHACTSGLIQTAIIMFQNAVAVNSRKMCYV